MRTCSLLAVALLLPGCISIQQAKPLEVNINFSGRLDLVVHDARDDVDRITGEKAQRVVNLEDIGLPAAPAPTPTPPAGSMAAPLPGARVALLDVLTAPLATEDSLKAAMTLRHKSLRALLDAGVAGEAHTGLVAARGTLTAAQQKTLDNENADRAALYAAEAARQKASPADIALAYYLARLGHAQTGDWYEKLNPTTKQWEWKHWNQP